jgi:hypothetical protein
MSVRPACMGNRARLSERSDKYRGRILDNKRQVSGVSAAIGGRNDQFNRERNFGLVLQINVFILVLKSEYRIMNIECRISKEGILSILN